jgi:hypothetical protein
MNPSLSPPASKPWVYFKLSLMMFLTIYIWGSWFVPHFSYVGKVGYLDSNQKWVTFTDSQQEWINNGFPIAAIVAMFGLTALVDRKFAAEKYLAFVHFFGGLAMVGLAYLRDFVSGDMLFIAFIVLMYIHCLAYVPTITVANSIAFTHLTDGAKYGRVRLWGTIGWIAASLPSIYLLTDWGKIGALGDLSFGDKLNAVFDPKYSIGAGAQPGSPEYERMLGATSNVYLLAGIASLILSALSWTLPHTPPKTAGVGPQENPTMRALSFLRKPFILVLFIVTFIDAAIHQGYFLVVYDFLGSSRDTNGVGLAPGLTQAVTSIGQFAEIFTMMILGSFLKKMGWRFTFIIGILGHAVRFAIFAYFPDKVPAIAVNLLHGICYAFFFATVYIFIDAYFPTDIRASAQGLFNFLILGLGVIVANNLWPRILSGFKTIDPVTKAVTKVDWNGYFLYPSAVALGGAILLLLFFHPPKKAENESSSIG